MKCDMCGKEFNNSEELKQHKEQVHPMDKGETPDIDRENPEIKREVADSDQVEMPPPPAERTR
ncbi:MAG: C2H2-type zinc finger protein [Candidatus Dormibacteraeota bacterium]|nr:C2H2-type zinc finger protein [Candidatus Dormibacteraeota bacterium]